MCLQTWRSYWRLHLRIPVPCHFQTEDWGGCLLVQVINMKVFSPPNWQRNQGSSRLLSGPMPSTSMIILVSVHRSHMFRHVQILSAEHHPQDNFCMILYRVVYVSS